MHQNYVLSCACFRSNQEAVCADVDFMHCGMLHQHCFKTYGYIISVTSNIPSRQQVFWSCRAAAFIVLKWLAVCGYKELTSWQGKTATEGE
jgi:hypothetical protein